MTMAMSTRRSLLLLLSTFVLGLSWVIVLATVLAPTTDPPLALSFPRDLEDLRALADRLNFYLSEANSASFYLFVLFVSVYIFKQTFAIPGSVFLNLLAGAVVGLPQGFVLCVLMNAIGATACYALSRVCARNLALRFFPRRVDSFRALLGADRSRLVSILLFLRLLPMSPNWAVNICCGVLEVPALPFFCTALVGLMPYNFVTVQTGVLLKSLVSTSDIITYDTMARFTLMAIVALLPGFLVRRSAVANEMQSALKT